MKQLLFAVAMLGLLGCPQKAVQSQHLTVASYAQPAYSCPMHPDVATNDPQGICVVCQMKTDTPVKPAAGKTHNIVLFPGAPGTLTLSITRPDDTHLDVPLTSRGDYFSLDVTLQEKGRYRLEAKSEKGLLAAIGLNL